MARYEGDLERYQSPDIPIQVDSDQLIIQSDGGGDTQIDQITVPQVVANQNDYPLPPGQVIRFSTDASRNFTGFAGSRSGIVAFSNVGSFDGVIVDNSASSAAANRVLCPNSGVNVTVSARKTALMFYDFQDFRWRIISLT